MSQSAWWDSTLLRRPLWAAAMAWCTSGSLMRPSSAYTKHSTRCRYVIHCQACWYRCTHCPLPCSEQMQCIASCHWHQANEAARRDIGTNAGCTCALFGLHKPLGTPGSHRVVKCLQAGVVFSITSSAHLGEPSHCQDLHIHNHNLSLSLCASVAGRHLWLHSRHPSHRAALHHPGEPHQHELWQAADQVYSGKGLPGRVLAV